MTLDTAVSEALDRTSVGVVVVHGPNAAAIAKPWTQQHRREFDMMLSVDLWMHQKLGGVDLTEVTAVLLQGARGRRGTLPEEFRPRLWVYRRCVADRKVLVHLKRPDQAAQVRPFIAGAPGSVVVVTSERRLSGLITEHAEFVDVAPELSRRS